MVAFLFFEDFIMINDINKLKQSLIYKMSLGSKELYHSNVWAWLMENDNSFIKAFFPDCNDDFHDFQIRREQAHRDLTIWFKNKENEWKCFVIENKLKSIPSLEQLDAYTKPLISAKFFAGGVLIGFKTPNIVSTEDGKIDVCGVKWQFLPYSKISERIRMILNKSISEPIAQNKNIIFEYLNNNDAMERIVNNHLIVHSLSQQTWDENLNELGLSDLINKTLGSMLINYVKSRLDEDKINFPFLYIGQGFHNKKITLDFRLNNWNEFQEKKYTYLKIGVQIEGFQYRRMIDRTCEYSNADKIFEEFGKKGFFDLNYDKKNKTISFPNDTISNRKTSLSKKYDKYGECCIYQYSIIEGDEAEFENIYQRIKNDLILSELLIIDNNSQPFIEKTN